MRKVRLVVLAILLACLAGAAPESAAATVGFAKLADEFVKAKGISEVPRDDAALAALLEAEYVTVRLGLFQVWHPAAGLAEAENARRFQAAAEALVRLQDTWLEWTAEKETVQQVEPASKDLHAWIRGWKSLGAAGGEGRAESGPDLLQRLEAKDSVAEAVAAYAAAAARLIAPARSEAADEGFMLVLCPTREDFLGFGSFLGSLNAENQRILLRDGLALWTSYQRAGVNVIALEHPANYPGRGDINEGVDMNAKEATGLEQHVVQTAAEWMIDYAYREAIPPAVVNGLAMHMVVALFKENNVRAGGGAGGRSTAAYSKFVRGGSSSGGKLPAISAEPRWRREKGSDYFLEELRAAQREGAEAAAKTVGRERDKRAFFILTSVDGSSDHAVEAPFLDGAGDGKTISDDYYDDFLEFHRAYRCAFTHWLFSKAKAAEGRAPSRDLVRRLLQALQPPAENDAERPSFERAVEEIYGQPLTAADAKTRSLEWAFLDWLSRSR